MFYKVCPVFTYSLHCQATPILLCIDVILVAHKREQREEGEVSFGSIFPMCTPSELGSLGHQLSLVITSLYWENLTSMDVLRGTDWLG